MIKCTKCGISLKNKPKTMLPNKTFNCEKKCKPPKKTVNAVEEPSSDTIEGRQAITILKPRNILNSKQQVLVYDNVAPIVVNADDDSKKFLRKGTKKQKEQIAPTIELSAKSDKKVRNSKSKS